MEYKINNRSKVTTIANFADDLTLFIPPTSLSQITLDLDKTDTAIAVVGFYAVVEDERTFTNERGEISIWTVHFCDENSKSEYE